MIEINRMQVGPIRLRLIERGKGDPIVSGPFFLITDHESTSRYYGLKFLANDQLTAESEFRRAIEREQARQAAEHEHEAQVG